MKKIIALWLLLGGVFMQVYANNLQENNAGVSNSASSNSANDDKSQVGATSRDSSNAIDESDPSKDKDPEAE